MNTSMPTNTKTPTATAAPISPVAVPDSLERCEDLGEEFDDGCAVAEVIGGDDILTLFSE